MSKEQTPITAEEFFPTNSGSIFDENGYFEQHHYDLTSQELKGLMEQYAQTKVLEALEREAELMRSFVEDDKRRSLKTTDKNKPTYYAGRCDALNWFINRIETEVKPKYKLK